jgi:ABC-type sugar transport system substrate-binding protein
MKSRGILALVVLALVSSAAAYAATSTSARSQQEKSIAFIPPVIANPIIKALNDAIKLKAESLGMKFTTVGGEYNPQAQIVAVDSVVQRKFDALLIWPLDPKGIQPSFDKARKAGIPIVVIESPKAGPYLANFSQQSYASAFAIGTYGAKAAKKKFGSCSVGIIQGIPVVDILRTRNIALEAAAKKQGCTVLDKQVNQKDNTDGARPIVDGWKTKYGSKMNLILAYNDPSALGAVSAVDSSFKPLITGENGDSLAIDAIKNHSLLATVSAPNVEMGEGMAQLTYNSIVKQRKVPKQVIVKYELITQQNVNRYKTPQARLALGPMNIRFVPPRGNASVLVATAGKK